MKRSKRLSKPQGRSRDVPKKAQNHATTQFPHGESFNTFLVSPAFSKVALYWKKLRLCPFRHKCRVQTSLIFRFSAVCVMAKRARNLADTYIRNSTSKMLLKWLFMYLTYLTFGKHPFTSFFLNPTYLLVLFFIFKSYDGRILLQIIL